MIGTPTTAINVQRQSIKTATVSKEISEMLSRAADCKTSGHSDLTALLSPRTCSIKAPGEFFRK